MGQSNLAERLGYEPDDRLLIINCDDLGSSHSANLATFQAMTRGVASSATLMVPCPWAREAARMFAGMPVGVHLTLTCEYEGYRWRGLTHGASLYDDGGSLLATTQQALRRVTADDARAECRAQILTAYRWGVDVTHLDTHMNVMQGREDLFGIYLDLANEFRLPVRIIEGAATVPPFGQARERAENRGLLFNQHMIYPWPKPTRDVLFEEVPKLPAGITEIFAHPATDGEELRGYDPKGAHIRAHDAAWLVDASVAAMLDRSGIKPISYREIRDLQRAS
jgi:chitin disaccharide deacetylase